MLIILMLTLLLFAELWKFFCNLISRWQQGDQSFHVSAMVQVMLRKTCWRNGNTCLAKKYLKGHKLKDMTKYDFVWFKH